MFGHCDNMLSLMELRNALQSRMAAVTVDKSVLLFHLADFIPSIPRLKPKDNLHFNSCSILEVAKMSSCKTTQALLLKMLATFGLL